MSETVEDKSRRMGLIQDALSRHGLAVAAWRSEYNGVEGVVGGRWECLVDDEERGLYRDGAPGVLSCLTVGAPEYANERAQIIWTEEGYEPASGEVVEPFVDVEPVL